MVVPEITPGLIEEYMPWRRYKKFRWTFENTSSVPVYCAWYEAIWSAERGDFVDPVRMSGKSVTILPGKGAPIKLPMKQTKKPSQRQILFSFDKSLLKSTVYTDEQNNVPAHIAKFNRFELEPTDVVWKIYNVDNTPSLLPFTHLIQVINTTNSSIYCAMFYVDSKEAVRVTPKVIRIKPQLSAQISYPPGKSSKKTQLFIAQKEQLGVLEQESILAKDQGGLTKKEFGSTNLVNWYLQAAYILWFDVQQGVNQVSSVGGGGLERILRKPVDIKGFKPQQIEEFETKMSDRDPLFVPSDFIRAAGLEKNGAPEYMAHEEEDNSKEDDFVKKRAEVVRDAINKLFKEEIIKEDDDVPKIALVFTGGGYRAMIETIGFIKGAAEVETNIFDCCTYMTGLSGSTWAINALVASGEKPDVFAEMQRYKVGKGGYLKKNGYSYMETLPVLVTEVVENPDYIRRRFIESRYAQYHGPLGLYGHAIANAVLDEFKVNGKGPHDMTLSDLRVNLEDGVKYPLPISVALDFGKTDASKNRIWYEFSPYYVGTHQEGGRWIDTELLGSTFDNNQIKQYVPEYPLAHYMGIWGSAFALTAHDIGKARPFLGYLASAVGGLGSGVAAGYNFLLWKNPTPSVCEGRVTAGQLPNFTYKLKPKSELEKDVQTRSKKKDDVSIRLTQDPFLCLVDGGILKKSTFRHNFSTVPALSRKVDVVIMCGSIVLPNKDTESQHLLGAAKEASRLKLPFPDLTERSRHDDTLAGIQKEVSTLIMEDDGPIVVYMKAKKIGEEGFDPDVDKAGFTATTNFNYTEDQYDKLTGLTSSIMSHKDTVENIKAAIEEAVRRKEVK